MHHPVEGGELHSFHLWLPKCNRNIVCYELSTKQWCIYLNDFGSRNVLVLIPHVFIFSSTTMELRIVLSKDQHLFCNGENS